MEFSTTPQIASASHPKQINGLRDENVTGAEAVAAVRIPLPRHGWL
jgi:hypothetical protein